MHSMNIWTTNIIYVGNDWKIWDSLTWKKIQGARPFECRGSGGAANGGSRNETAGEKDVGWRAHSMVFFLGKSGPFVDLLGFWWNISVGFINACLSGTSWDMTKSKCWTQTRNVLLLDRSQLFRNCYIDVFCSCINIFGIQIPHIYISEEENWAFSLDDVLPDCEPIYCFGYFLEWVGGRGDTFWTYL